MIRGIRILALVAVTAVGGCHADWDQRAATQAAHRAAGTAAPDVAHGTLVGGIPGLGASATAGPAVPRTQFASAPDRGDLVAYPAGQVVRRDGAYTWHRADVSEDHALRAIVDGTLHVAAPDGSRLAFEYERHVEHASGDWTWIGRLAGEPDGMEAILTFGADAVFGTLATGSGRALRLTTREGVSWIVESDPRGVAAASRSLLERAGRDFLLPPAPPAAGGRGEAFIAAASAAGTDAPATGAASENAATTVDVVVGYTSGYATSLGGKSQATTRLNFLFDVGNTALVNSGVDARFRMVHAMQVNYPDATSNSDALEDVTGYDSETNQYVAPASAFTGLRNARETYGADLVTVVRKFSDPENAGCGIAWLVGGGLSQISPGYEYFGYSVVSDGTDQGSDGLTYYCRDETLVHEFGHNAGAAHDVETAKGDDGVLDNPDDYGRYSYSFGYKTGVAGGNLYTVMAYGDDGQTAFRIFSNPRSNFCAGNPCGAANADNARTLAQTLPLIAAFRDEVVVEPDPVQVGPGVRLKELDTNGNGRSDLFFFNHGLDRIATWFMNGPSIGATSSVTVDGSYRVVDTGDFDRDGRSDLLLTSGLRDVRIAFGTSTGYTNTAVPLSYSLKHSIVGAADINGDGRSDILLRHADTGTTTIWYMDGANRFAYTSFSVSAALKYVGSGDLNADGRSELLWIDNERRVFISANQGGPLSTVSTGLQHSSAYVLLGLQDVNGDGRSDMLLHSESLKRLVVWYMSGTTRTAYISHATVAGFRVMGKGDYDGNRRGDLAFRNPATGQVRLMLGRGYSYVHALMGPVPTRDAWLMDLE